LKEYNTFNFSGKIVTTEFNNDTVGGTEHMITKSTSFSLTNSNPLESAPTRIEPVIFFIILVSSFSVVKVNLCKELIFNTFKLKIVCGTHIEPSRPSSFAVDAFFVCSFFTSVFSKTSVSGTGATTSGTISSKINTSYHILSNIII